MTQQLAIRIADELGSGLDELVMQGRFPNRTAAVRAAIGLLVERERRAVLGEAIIAGYRRIPETADELASADANLRRLIEEERW